MPKKQQANAVTTAVAVADWRRYEDLALTPVLTATGTDPTAGSGDSDLEHGLSFQYVAATMTGLTQEQYAEMMLKGGRPIEGNRSKSEWKKRG